MLDLTLVQLDRSRDSILGKSTVISLTTKWLGRKLVIVRLAVSNQLVHTARSVLKEEISTCCKIDHARQHAHSE